MILDFRSISGGSAAARLGAFYDVGFRDLRLFLAVACLCVGEGGVDDGLIFNGFCWSRLLIARVGERLNFASLHGEMVARRPSHSACMSFFFLFYFIF